MTYNDPFATATAPAPEPAQPDNVTPGPWETAPAPAPAVVKTAAVGDGDGKIVLTFKEAAGFDASWTVVHAASVADAKQILLDPEFRELLDLSKRAAGYFRGGDVKQSGGGNGGGGQRSSAPPQGATEPPPGTPAAPGPDWVYKSGFKNGKPWKAWMPPRGSSESPVWL